MDASNDFITGWTNKTRKTHPNLTLPEHLVVGEAMQELMQELQAHGKTLLKALNALSLDSNAHNLLSKYVSDIDKQSCHIAVIGQMKAGKSSFINALIGYENLLPSDVNPWTTVVTRLHFGGTNLPDEGAEFSFFDANQWLQLAKGETKLRTLVERFLPGFESDRLSQQLEEMRTQAERRLGSQFHELLGHSHWFDHVTPDIMKRYVCAGTSWKVDEEPSDIGQYSDITETADIYFKRAPFAYPTTITDTPGTNDPFFVRDEITFRSLESADIFIVVLTAQQAFSISDLALLRILQGLQKDRIIIYINRIDQLDDWKQDSEEIISHVQYMLQREFPSVQFPVIAGSALWGKMALNKKNGNGNGYKRYENQLEGYTDAPETIKIDSGEILTKDQARSELYNCSGIPDVAETISRLMLSKSKNRGSVSKIASTLKLTADSLIAVMSNKLHSIQSEMKRLGLSHHIPKGDVNSLSQKQTELKRLISKCQALQIHHDQELEQVQHAILDSFRTKLNEIVIAFARSECQKLVASMQSEKRKKVWRCDTIKMRQSLEDEFLVICKEATNHINNMQLLAIDELKRVLQTVSPHIDSDFLSFKEILEGEPYLSTLALKHKLALDLDHSWWKLWAQKHTPEHWSKELDKLIKSEFFPMVERLVQSAKAELKQRVDESGVNLSTMIQSVVNITEDKIKKLQSQFESLNYETERYETPGSSVNRLPELERALHTAQSNLDEMKSTSQKLKEIIIYHNNYLEGDRAGVNYLKKNK